MGDEDEGAEDILPPDQFGDEDLAELADLATAMEEDEESADPAEHNRTFAGTPLPDPATLREDEQFMERFVAKVKVSLRSDACWVWRGVRKSRGYGQVRILTLRGWRTMQAHRVAFMLWYGRWPNPDLVLCHSCHNPACVNPSHLSEGTHEQNMRHMKQAGRWRNQYGAGTGYPPPPTFIEPAATEPAAVQ